MEGTIAVETYPEGDRVRINIRDSGVGMTPEQAAMERELKALVQQYMTRMTDDRLTAPN